MSRQLRPTGLGAGASGYLEPPAGVTYPQLLRGTADEWWRPMLGIVLGISMYFLVIQAVNQAIVGIGWAVGSRRQTYAAFFASAVKLERPIGMLATNLAIAAFIPITWLLIALIHRIRPRWLSSVRPWLRWRYLTLCLVIAAVVFSLVLLLSSLPGHQLKVSPQPGFWSFLAVIVLTSPLQAAAEEYFFRGYLMQAFGSLVANPWFGVVTSAVVFALFHGVQSPALFIDRLAFGLLAATLVLKTGGLEAGIAAHVINNIFAFVLAGLTSSIATVRALTSIGWLDALVDVGGFALFAAIAWWAALRMTMQVTVGSKPSLPAGGRKPV